MAHKKLKPKYISFLIVPENRKEPKSFRVRTGALRLALAALITVLVLIILGAVSYWKVAQLALDNNRLREENFKLVKSLQQMDKIKEDLGLIQNYEKQLRSSLSGYVTIEKLGEGDSLDLGKIDFDKMSADRRNTIFNTIPAAVPVEGFMARGFDASSLLTDAHLGVDIAAPTGTPVKAPADGIVMFSGWTVDGGNVLIIEHAYGFISVYKHNQRNLVNEVEKVAKGQVIALLGNTGKITSGPHLHFEIWHNGLPVNPIHYFSEGKFQDKS